MSHCKDQTFASPHVLLENFGALWAKVSQDSPLGNPEGVRKAIDVFPAHSLILVYKITHTQVSTLWHTDPLSHPAFTQFSDLRALIQTERLTRTNQPNKGLGWLSSVKTNPNLFISHRCRFNIQLLCTQQCRDAGPCFPAWNTIHELQTYSLHPQNRFTTYWNRI